MLRRLNHGHLVLVIHHLELSVILGRGALVCLWRPVKDTLQVFIRENVLWIETRSRRHFLSLISHSPSQVSNAQLRIIFIVSFAPLELT